MDTQKKMHRSVRHRSTGLCRGCGKPTESRWGYCHRTRECHAGQQRGRSAARRAGIGPVVLVTVPCESCGQPTSSRYCVCERTSACKAMRSRRELGRPDPVTCTVCHKTETTPGIGICTLYPGCRAARDELAHPGITALRGKRAADLDLEPDERRCARCQHVQPLDIAHFPHAATVRLGYSRTCQECTRSGVAASQLRAREWMRQYKESHPCTDCGRKFPAPAMQWDHKPGHPKANNVSQMVSLRQIRAELEHVDLVCAVCHALRTKSREWIDVTVFQSGEPCAICAALETGHPEWLSPADTVLALRKHKLEPCADCGRELPYYAMALSGTGADTRQLKKASWTRLIEALEGSRVLCMNCCAVEAYARRFGKPRRTVRVRASHAAPRSVLGR